MANEVTVTGNLAYSDANGVEVEQELSFTMSLSAPIVTKNVITIATSETALDLGGVTGPVLLILVNLDATNFVNVKVATSGAICSKLLPGKGLIIPLGSGMQAPYLIADTAACKVAYIIC